MSFVSTFGFVFLVLMISARVYSRAYAVSNIARIFWTAALGVATSLIVLSHLQFDAWANGTSITQGLVPPFGGHWYFLFYVWWRFWAPYAISFVVAGIFFWLARWYNKRHGEQFFYDEEYYFIALGIFLTGQPGWILYLFIMAFFAFLVTFIRRVFLHRIDKLPLYDFWLPVAAFGIIMMQWLQVLPWLAAFKP